jgi:hypothetical protein
VPAKCTQCGAALEVDKSQDAAICPYCKTPFIVDKAINNYNVGNIDTISAAVVNVYDQDTSEELEHKDRIRLAELEHERYKLEQKAKKARFEWRILIGLLVGGTALPIIIGAIIKLTS